MFFKRKQKPFEGLSVTTMGFDENKFFNVRKESDLYNLSPGDTVSICVDYHDDCLDPKYLEINHLIFFKHRLGRDYFLANYQKGLVEYSGKRKNIKVIEKFGFGHFILLDKKDKKIRDIKKDSKEFYKRWGLINGLWEFTEPTGWY